MAAERSIMAEYLSPGVYVEEFDSGIKAMEGVGTSTAGFVGMAQKGPVRGLPVLITSMADYQRRFGGYLSERDYGNKRFLPYAVEQFFNNGGSTCYVMRVCPEEGAETAQGILTIGAGEDKDAGGEGGSGDAQETGGEGGSGDAQETGGEGASGDKKDAGTEGAQPFLVLTAANPGAWGNGIRVRFTPLLKNRVRIGSRSPEGVYGVKSADGYQAGDLVCIQYAGGAKEPFYSRVKETAAGSVTLEWAEPADAPTDQEDASGQAEGAQEGASGQGEGAQEGAANQEGAAQENAAVESFLYLVEWNLTVADDTVSEQYEGVSFHPGRNNYIEHAVKKSQLITAQANEKELQEDNLSKLIRDPREPVIEVAFQGGSDGEVKPDAEPDAKVYIGQDGAPDARTGLTAFKTLTDVSIMAIPGITDDSVQSALVSHCEEMKSRFAILDVPLDFKEVSQLQAFKEGVDSSYAAMYHPWLQCYDALANRKVFLPPSGSMAGIYARTDNSRGVHKAPANEVVRNCTGLSVNYNEAEQGKLNPKGINLIRSLPGQGIRVWGARTCSSDGNWKYVNVRRLFIFLEESIKANTNWAVFEPNDEVLWSRVEGTIRVFLTTQWRNGALSGATADEAFFINIGKSTMTEDDILNGRLICVIGVAPVRPAEFVIFRITQKMESAQ